MVCLCTTTDSKMPVFRRSGVQVISCPKENAVHVICPDYSILWRGVHGPEVPSFSDRQAQKRPSAPIIHHPCRDRFVPVLRRTDTNGRGRRSAPVPIPLAGTGI